MKEEQKYTTLDQLKKASANPRQESDVKLPVCGLVVKIQSLTEKEKVNFESSSLSRDGSKRLKNRVLDARRRLIIACTAEPKLSSEDVSMLGQFNGKDMQVWGDACTAISGFSDDDIEAIDALEKN